MESSSESNWTLSDIGLRSVGCGMKLSYHAPPSQLHLSSGLSSFSLSPGFCHLVLMRLLLIVAHKQDDSVHCVYLYCFCAHERQRLCFSGHAHRVRHCSECNTQGQCKQKRTHTQIHIHTPTDTLPPPFLLPPVLLSTQPPPSLHPFTRTSAPPA